MTFLFKVFTNIYDLESLNWVSMNYQNVSSVIVGIIFSAVAQICMKKASVFDVKTITWFLFIAASILSYFISFVAYYFALKVFPISKIGPIMTVSVIALVVLFGFASGETISGRRLAGLTLGFLSIILIM